MAYGALTKDEILKIYNSFDTSAQANAPIAPSTTRTRKTNLPERSIEDRMEMDRNYRDQVWAQIPKLEEQYQSNSQDNTPKTQEIARNEKGFERENKAFENDMDKRLKEKDQTKRARSVSMEQALAENSSGIKAGTITNTNNLTDKDVERLAEIDKDIQRLSSNRSAQNDRRISGLQAEKNKLMGQTLSQGTDDRTDVIDKWLDTEHKMTDSEVEQAKQIVADYEANEYKNSNVNELTDEEKQRQSQMFALKDKISKSEAAVYGSMNATVNPLLEAADNDYFGWTVDDLRNEVANQRDIPMSPEVKATVDQLQGEINDLQNTLNDKNTVYSTGDAAVDEATGATTTMSKADAMQTLEEKQKQMYKLMLESAKGEQPTDYDSYNLRKANAQKQNPLQYTAGDMATRVAETAAIQGAMGSNGFAADVIADNLTDTIPEYLSNRAQGMSQRDALNQAVINEAINLGIDSAPLLLNKLAERRISDTIPKLDPNNPPNPPIGETTEIPHMAPEDLVKQNEIDVNAKVDNVNRAVDVEEDIDNIFEPSKEMDEVPKSEGYDPYGVEQNDIRAAFEQERANRLAEIEQLRAAGRENEAWEAELDLADYENAMVRRYPELADVPEASEIKNTGSTNGTPETVDTTPVVDDTINSQNLDNIPPENNVPIDEGNVPPEQPEPIELTQEARGDERERGLSRHIRDEEYAFYPKTKGTYNINKDGYIEVSFKKKPDKDTIDALKDRGFKYNAKEKVWTAKNGSARLELAESIQNKTPIRSKNMMQMANVSNEVQADFRDNPDMYKALRNADTKNLAQSIYESGDTPVSINGKVYEGNVEAKFRELLSEKNPASLPLGDQIAKDYSAAGNHAMAAQIYRDMGEALTDSGRFSQAAVLTMLKNDPLTALAYFERELRALNKAGAEKYGKKWHDFILTDEERALFDNITPGDTAAIKKAYDTIGQRIEKEYPVTFWEKVLEFRRVAMLANMRTVGRNFLANPPTDALRFVSNRIEGIGQHIAHLINPEIDINQSVLAPSRENRKLATDIFNSDQVQALLKNNPGRLSEIPRVGDYAKSKQIFKGGFVSKWVNDLTNGGVERLNSKLGKEGAESLMEAARGGAYKALEVTDYPFVKDNFISRLGSYIRAKGIKDASQIGDDAILMALEEANKATYKDNSWLVKAIKKVKGATEDIGNSIVPGLGDVASQALIPYVQAPGNIGARIVDYSPVGAAKGIGKIIKGATSNTPKMIQQGIEEFSKGATGSLLAGLGMALYKSGVITGAYSNDPDQKAFEKQHGFREFAIRYKVNGQTKYDTIDWAQPFVDVLMQGVLLQQAIEASDEYDSDILRYFGHEGTTAGKIIGAARETARKEVNYFFNSTPLKNLADLFASRYSEPDIAGNVWDNTVNDFVSGLIPAQVAAIAKTVDPTQRQTYSPTNTFETFMNSLQAKLPGKSDDLAPKYDTLGRPMKYGNSSVEAGFAKMLYPGEHTTDISDTVDNEISRLFESTGNNAVFPMVAPSSVEGRKLNAQEVSDLQGDMGERTREIAFRLISSDAYQDMDDAKKVEALDSIYKVSKAISERDLFGKEVSDTYAKAVEAYDNGQIEGLLNYFRGNELQDVAGVSGSSKAGQSIKDLVAKGMGAQAEQLAENISVLSDNGVSTLGQGTYSERGTKYLSDMSPEQYADLWNTINTNNTSENPNDNIAQDEMLAFFNSNPNVVKDQNTAMSYWLGMLSKYDDNTKVPYYDHDSKEWKTRTRTDDDVKLINSLTNGEPIPEQTAQEPVQEVGEEPQQAYEPITTLDPNFQPNDINEVFSLMADNDLNTSAASGYWNAAKVRKPDLTPGEFYQVFNAIDSALGPANGGVSKPEWVKYLNDNGLDYKDDLDIINWLYSPKWGKLKYVDDKWQQ